MPLIDSSGETGPRMMKKFRVEHQRNVAASTGRIGGEEAHSTTTEASSSDLMPFFGGLLTCFSGDT